MVLLVLPARISPSQLRCCVPFAPLVHLLLALIAYHILLTYAVIIPPIPIYYIIMRKGDRIRSLTFLCHERLIHCSRVNSRACVTSQVNNSSIWRANASLYTSALIS